MEKIKINLEVTEVYTISGVVESETEETAIEKVMNEYKLFKPGTVVRILNAKKANRMDLELYENGEVIKQPK